MTLREILDAAAGETPGVDGAVDGEGGTTWSAGGTVFAILSADGSTASFLLDPIVANAAARTPDVKRSSRGCWLGRSGATGSGRPRGRPGSSVVPVWPPEAHWTWGLTGRTSAGRPIRPCQILAAGLLGTLGARWGARGSRSVRGLTRHDVTWALICAYHSRGAYLATAAGSMGSVRPPKHGERPRSEDRGRSGS